MIGRELWAREAGARGARTQSPPPRLSAMGRWLGKADEAEAPPPLRGAAAEDTPGRAWAASARGSTPPGVWAPHLRPGARQPQPRGARDNQFGIALRKSGNQCLAKCKLRTAFSPQGGWGWRWRSHRRTGVHTTRHTCLMLHHTNTHGYRTSMRCPTPCNTMPIVAVWTSTRTRRATLCLVPAISLNRKHIYGISIG